MTSGSLCLALDSLLKLIQGPCNSAHAGRGVSGCQFQELAPRRLASIQLGGRAMERALVGRYTSCFTYRTRLIKEH